ncbi:hypothetical protein VA7868_00826 [Vibrio aerogenes CECT 7868]|uniref:Uncharacterized protein n=1 Tax=Vibrio aerogenes CECT 7868 TaxID=1216006 RepID=A0A1M5WQR8_9VIBR|nr:hypothetical protein [Vibrio aerogenes]SHH89831.1 hypothetical protein VA7868_00826 [Vibrio aerogenes CECT 7868]
MHQNYKSTQGITANWASPHQPEGKKFLDIEYESQSGLTFEQAINFAKNFNWQQELDKLNQGEGTAGLLLHKAESEQDIMSFSLLPLDKDVFLLSLDILNKSQKRGFWDKASASVDLGECSMDELEVKLSPLHQYSISQLYDQYREQSRKDGIKQRIACTIFIVMLFCFVGFLIGHWIDPLMSPSFDKRFWPSLLYVGGPLSVLFAFTAHFRQSLKGATFGTQLMLVCGLIFIGPMSVLFMVQGIAVPLHLLIAEPGTQIERVSDKSDDWYGHGRGSCDGKLWLRSPSDPSAERLLCDVPKAVWHHVSVGDMLLLEGAKSPIAMTVKKISFLSGEKEKISDE